MPNSGAIVGRERVTTWMEYGVAAAIVGVIAAVLLGVLLYYEELGEKTGVELTILNIRAGLRYQVADRIMKGKTGELAALDGSNPVRWLERPPAGYAGERRGASLEFMERGEWCFDPELKELRYRPRLRSNLSPDLRVLRWRVVPVFGTTGNRSIDSLALVNVEPYRWFQ
jgi:hypothetical protein